MAEGCAGCSLLDCLIWPCQHAALVPIPQEARLSCRRTACGEAPRCLASLPFGSGSRGTCKMSQGLKGVLLLDLALLKHPCSLQR